MTIFHEANGVPVAASSPTGLACPRCGGTRFRHAVYTTAIFDSVTGNVEEPEIADQLDDLAAAACVSCSFVVDGDHPVWRAIVAAYTPEEEE